MQPRPYRDKKVVAKRAGTVSKYMQEMKSKRLDRDSIIKDVCCICGTDKDLTHIRIGSIYCLCTKHFEDIADVVTSHIHNLKRDIENARV